MIIVNVVGITLLGVFLIYVFNKKQKSLQDKLLLAIILVFAGYLASNILVETELTVFTFLLQNFFAALTFFPFLVYALILISKDHSFDRAWWWFASYDLVYLSFLLVDLLVGNRLEGSTISQLYEDPPLIYLVFYRGHGVYKVVVLVWLLSRLGRYGKQIREYYSDLSPVSLNWLTYFTWIYLAVNAVSTLIFLLYNYGYISQIEIPFFVTNLVFVLSLCYLIFKGAKQYTSASFDEKEDSREQERSRQKYHTSSLSDEEMDRLYSEIENLFANEQLFLNAELKVNHLAERVGVTINTVSQTINVKAKKPFYDYVNAFRIEYFKDLLKDPKMGHYTILALGMESGFNSKASLNRVFKEQVGTTPREFQRRKEQ